MSELKNKIRADLTTAMKAREKERTGTLRMLLAAIQTEETSGSKHELTDEDVLKVIAREIKKRRESAEAGRSELADAETNEANILAEYQPQQLDDDELATLVAEAVAQVKAELGEDVSMKQMGQVMKLATAQAAGRVDGKRLSTAVRAALA